MQNREDWRGEDAQTRLYKAYYLDILYQTTPIEWLDVQIYESVYEQAIVDYHLGNSTNTTWWTRWWETSNV